MNKCRKVITRNTSFGRDVISLANIAYFGRDRGYIDNRSTSSVLNELLTGNLGDEESPFEINVDNFIKSLVVHWKKETVLGYAYGAYEEWIIKSERKVLFLDAF